MSEIKVLDDGVVFEQTLRVFFDPRQLTSLVAEAALREAFDPDLLRRLGPSVSAEVRFEDVTEGSPPYKVGVRAIVKVTRDLSQEYLPTESAS